MTQRRTCSLLERIWIRDLNLFQNFHCYSENNSIYSIVMTWLRYLLLYLNSCFGKFSIKYQKAPLVSLCSSVGAAGAGVLMEPQGLVFAAVPTPGASLPGERVSGPWLMEPKQQNISSLVQINFVKSILWILSVTQHLPYLPTCAMVFRLRGNQRFGLSLDFVQPAVQLPLVGGRGLGLEGKRNSTDY